MGSDGQGGLRFGTDGVRDVAGEGMLSPDSVERLGLALADWLAEHGSSERPVLLGGDTRQSRGDIADQLSTGLTARGLPVLDLGILPTAALALVMRDYGASCSVVISASHNAAADNGIKVFTEGCAKLDDDDASWVERRWTEVESGLPADASLRKTVSEGGDKYAAHLKAAVPDLELSGMKIAVDLAHGAASHVAPRILRDLGAEVIVTGGDPDGLNINDGCGALHPEAVAGLVTEVGADFGVAVDGDADRSIFADEKGRVVDGDAVLALIGTDLDSREELPERTVVGTVMTNFGLQGYLEGRGMVLERTPVGDKYISARLKQGGLALGGEQSGHIIFGADLQYLGDGIYSALRVAEVLRRVQAPLSELSRIYEPAPQVLLNVPVARRPPLSEVSGFQEKVADAEERLGGEGRVLIRYSGTEPLVRVMVEGRDAALIGGIADSLASFLKSELGSC